MFNHHDLKRNAFMLTGSFAKRGYDWWWHSFTAVNEDTGEEKPFFIEYFLCNPALGGEEPILGQAEMSQVLKEKPSYLMVKAGCWGEDATQLHKFIGWKHVHLHAKAPYQLKAGAFYASDHEIRGSIDILPEEAEAHPEWMCDAGSMQWNLKVSKEVAYNVGYGAGGLFRKLKAFEMYWHAEGMKTLYEGTIIFNGQRYKVEKSTSYGYADKNWGRGFTSPWVWLSSCCIRSNITDRQLKDTVFDIGGGKPRVFGIALDRKLLGGIWYEGKPYEFNFSKFWTRSKTQFSYDETETEILWHVRQENRTHVMETEARCQKKDMLLVNYEEPDGRKRHNRLWNGGNGTATIRLYKKRADGSLLMIDSLAATHMGCEYGEFDY